MAQGYGYQPADVLNPVPNTDAGVINVRANVAEAGAGMDKVAQAGKEAESVADKIQRQQDMNDALTEKNESAARSNQAMLEFLPKMTGNSQQDQAAWDAISAKIGQDSLRRLATPAAQQAFTKEFDALHRDSIIQVQKQSINLQLKNFQTQAEVFRSNVTKNMQAIVKVGGPDYVVQVEQQFQGYSDLINASPLLSQAQKDAIIEDARPKTYLDVVKYQSEVTPGAFSRDWRDGVWTKHLSPEAVVQLQPFAEKAEITSWVNVLQMKYPSQPGVQIKEALSPQWRDEHGATAEQQQQVVKFLEIPQTYAWQQRERNREIANQEALRKVATAAANSDIVTLQAFAKDGRLPYEASLKALDLANSAMKFHGNDQLYSAWLAKAATGADVQSADVMRDLGTWGLSPEQALHVVRVATETPTPDKLAFAEAQKMIKSDTTDEGLQQQFISTLRDVAQKEGLHGRDIVRRGEELRQSSSSWFNPLTYGDRVYQKLYTDTYGLGTLKVIPGAAPTGKSAEGGTIEERAASFLRQNGKLVNPETVKAVIDRQLVK